MPAEVLNPADYLVTPHSVGPWVVGVLTATLGITVLFRERGSRVSLALCLLTMSVAVWLLSIGTVYATLHEPLALWWVRTEHVGVTFIPSLVLLFTLVILQRLEEFRAVAWGSLVISGLFYGSILATDWFITGLYRYPWGYYSRYGPLSVAFLVFFFSLLLGSLRLLQVELDRAAPGVPRQRIKSLLAAFGVGYLGAVDYLGAYGIPVYPFGYVPVFGFVVLMSATVWRYRLREITPALAAEPIIQTMADALLVLDREGTVRVANQASFQLFGCSRTELVGRPISAALGDLFGQEKIEGLARSGVMREYETHYRTREGRSLTLDITGSVTRDLADDPVAFVFIIRDVTERKQLEERLSQAQKLESLGRLAGEIAHDFETIFKDISRHSALLLNGLDKYGPAHGRVEEIKKDVDRAAELTRQLLTFSGSRQLKPMRLDLNALVTNLRGVLQWMLGKEIELTLILDPDLGWVKADAEQIEQAIIKLVGIAREGMSRIGRLIIETTNVQVAASSPDPQGIARPGKYALLSIRTIGWVVDEGTRTHFFEPFTSMKEQGMATGLKLAVIYGIVKQSGGHIAVENELDYGTVFRIHLPLTTRALPVAEIAAPAHHFAN
jgi:PAS domain S-box-containing protein